MQRTETIMLAVLGLLSIASIVWAAASNAESNVIDKQLAVVRAMTPEEQSRLLANKQRFDRLTPAEQQRLREVREQLEAEADTDELRGVLERYDQWLADLSFADSSSVRSLPIEKRVERIKQLRHKQLQEQIELSAREKSLTNQDSLAVRRWWADFVSRNEKQLIEKLPSNARELLNNASPDRRLQRLEWMAITHRSRKPSRGKPSVRLLVKPTHEEIEKLIAALSPPTQQRLERISSDDARIAVITGWIQSDLRRRFKKSIAPYVDPKELSKFRDEHLRPEELTKIKKLSEPQQRRELAKRYIQWKMSKRRSRGSDSHDGRREQDRSQRPEHRGPRPGPPHKFPGGTRS